MSYDEEAVSRFRRKILNGADEDVDTTFTEEYDEEQFDKMMRNEFQPGLKIELPEDMKERISQGVTKRINEDAELLAMMERSRLYFESAKAQEN